MLTKTLNTLIGNSFLNSMTIIEIKKGNKKKKIKVLKTSPEYASNAVPLWFPMITPNLFSEISVLIPGRNNPVKSAINKIIRFFQ